MTNLRFRVVEEAFKKKPLDVEAPVERPSEYFGKNVFTRATMYKYLPKDVYARPTAVIHALVPAADRGHRREARRLHRA